MTELQFLTSDVLEVELSDNNEYPPKKTLQSQCGYENIPFWFRCGFSVLKWLSLYSPEKCSNTVYLCVYL